MCRIEEIVLPANHCKVHGLTGTPCILCYVEELKLQLILSFMARPK